MSITNSNFNLSDNGGMKHEAFAKRFVLACKEANLPEGQTDLGKCFGVSGPMVHGYRSGDKMPSMGTAIIIAGKTGVSVEWLLTGRGTKHPEQTALDDGLVKVAIQLASLPKPDRDAVTALIDSLTKKTVAS